MTNQHVLINGAGPAGLSLSIALAKRNIRSTLIEIRKGPSALGGTIALAPNALRVLDKTIGIYDGIRQVGFEFEVIEFYSNDGWRLGGAMAGNTKEYGYPSLRLNRSTLVKALFRCTKEYPDLITIYWKNSIKNIQENTDGVVITLEDGHIIRGDILVGADGIHSKIRQYVLGDRSPTPVYGGQYGIGGYVERHEINWHNFQLPALIYSRQGATILFPCTPDGNRIAWGVLHTVPEKSREGWLEYLSSGDALKDVKNCFNNEDQLINEILSKTPVETMRGWPPYFIPDLPTWHTDRVLLIGDAAHCIPPYTGQGTAQALEDAGYLARILSDRQALQNGYAAAFEHFEKIRKKRHEYIRRLTTTSGKSRESANRFWFCLKKYVMWMFLSLHRGGYLRDGRIFQYDVNAQSLRKIKEDQNWLSQRTLAALIFLVFSYLVFIFFSTFYEK